MMPTTRLRLALVVLLCVAAAPLSRGEDGYKLWLRSALVTDAATRTAYQ